MVVVVMGVSGVGKSTVGRQLAQRMGCRFSDADEFHSESSIAKMRAGTALTDRDREPWLERMSGAIADWNCQESDHVLACSALKARYRASLRHGCAELQFVYLKGSHALVAARLEGRAGHFFAPQLLDDQFAMLEEPLAGEALVLEAALPCESIVERIITALAQDSGEY